MISRDTFRNEWTGLSTDDWSLDNPVFKDRISNGDTGFEMDTSKVKKFDESTQDWLALN